MCARTHEHTEAKPLDGTAAGSLLQPLHSLACKLEAAHHHDVLLLCLPGRQPVGVEEVPLPEIRAVQVQHRLRVSQHRRTEPEKRAHLKPTTPSPSPGPPTAPAPRPTKPDLTICQKVIMDRFDEWIVCDTAQIEKE